MATAVGPAVWAETLYVPGEYATIQAAIDAAVRGYAFAARSASALWILRIAPKVSFAALTIAF